MRRFSSDLEGGGLLKSGQAETLYWRKSQSVTFALRGKRCKPAQARLPFYASGFALSRLGIRPPGGGRYRTLGLH